MRCSACKGTGPHGCAKCGGTGVLPNQQDALARVDELYIVETQLLPSVEVGLKCPGLAPYLRSVVRECRTLRECLREIAVYGNKHMPANEYALSILKDLAPEMYADAMERAK